MKRLILALMFIAPFVTYAEQIPSPLGADERIKVVTYNPHDIVKLYAQYGHIITIEYEKDEFLTDKQSGVLGAWSIAEHQNLVYIKPLVKTIGQNTNLTIRTNKRTYVYELVAMSPARARTEQITFKVSYLYEDSDRKRRQSRQTAWIEQQNVQDQQIDITKLNFDYAVAGSDLIMPIQVFSDREFMYLRFHKLSPIPAIFSVNGRDESLVNHRSEGLFVVVEGLFDQLTLRRGKDKVVVKYDPSIWDYRYEKNKSKFENIAKENQQKSFPGWGDYAE